jgi:hypothetical protein
LKLKPKLKLQWSGILGGGVLIKILYLILVLSTVALLWAAGAVYVRIRRHLAARPHEHDRDREHERATRGD